MKEGTGDVIHDKFQNKKHYVIFAVSFLSLKRMWYMTLPAVHIDRWPFFNMLFSAVEVAKTECVGWLWGSLPTASRKYYRIVNAAQLGNIKKRLNSGIIINNRGITQTDNLINALPSFKYPRMGGFHSHVEWGSVLPPMHLSPTDIRFMIDWEKKIEIIIIILWEI